MMAKLQDCLTYVRESGGADMMARVFPFLDDN